MKIELDFLNLQPQLLELTKELFLKIKLDFWNLQPQLLELISGINSHSCLDYLTLTGVRILTLDVLEPVKIMHKYS